MEKAETGSAAIYRPRPQADHRIADERLPDGFARRRVHLQSYNAAGFPLWTSAHAIPMFAHSRQPICYLFWLAIIAAAIGVLVWQIVELVKHYEHHDVSTRTEVAFTQRVFPAVTVCDANPYKWSIAQNNPQVNELISVYNYSAQKLICKGKCSFNQINQMDELVAQYGMSNFTDTVSLTVYTQRLLVLVAYNQTDLEVAAAQQNDFLQGCSFNTQDCYPTDWSLHKDPQLGNCFTFNLNGNRSVNRAGPIYGLRVILKTNITEYLPTTPSVGALLLIHDQREPPFPDTYGISLQPNFATSVGISAEVISRLGKPYGDCVRKAADGYIYAPLDYTTEACERTQYQRVIVEKCGCFDPTFPRPANGTAEACRVPQDVECWSSMMQSSANDWNCVVACEETVYNTAVSTARWPSGSISTIGQCEEGDYVNQTCAQMYSANGAFVEIYFENLSYQSLNESAAYTFPTLLSDVGGQIGLWMGLALISLVEFALLIIQCFFSCLCPLFGQKIAY